MATIRTAIQIQDGMTPAMRSMTNALNICINSFEAMQNASGNAVDTASLSVARAELARVETAMNDVEQNIRAADEAQHELNDDMQSASSVAEEFAGKIKTVVGAIATIAGVTKVMDLSDTFAQTTARLDLMNDGMQLTAELQEKIFQSAQRSRGLYQSTADAVSKLGMQAKEAFGSNDELIAFTEQLNKTFVIAGASAVGVDSVMLQLTQSMAAGKLQGEELNAVLDNAQPIVANIQNYLQNVKGMPKSVTENIKQLASDGVITAEIIKNAMFYAADETNRKFAAMPVTFGQVWNSIQNTALKAFQPVLKMINGFVNNDIFNALLSRTANTFSSLGTMAENAFTSIVDSITWGIQSASSAFMFFGNLVWGIMPAVIGLLAGYGGFWLVANANMLVNSAIASIVAARTWTVATAQAAWTTITGGLITAQRLLSLTLAFNPIGLVIGLVVGAIAIFGAWQIKTYGLRQTFADVFGFIVDVVETAVNFIVSSINTIIRSFNSIGGFTGKVMGFEYSEIKEVSYRADFSGIKSAGQNFIKDFSMDNLFQMPDVANNASNNYKSVMDAATAGDIADTAANTGKMKDSLDITEEDLKYLRDIAEQEVINRFTTAEIKVDMKNYNNINNEMDLDGMVNYVKDSLVKTVQTAAEKVHK
jgi:tape measure domain-containing protein